MYERERLPQAPLNISTWIQNHENKQREIDRFKEREIVSLKKVIIHRIEITPLNISTLRERMKERGRERLPQA